MRGTTGVLFILVAAGMMYLAWRTDFIKTIIGSKAE